MNLLTRKLASLLVRPVYLVTSGEHTALLRQPDSVAEGRQSVDRVAGERELFHDLIWPYERGAFILTANANSTSFSSLTPHAWNRTITAVLRF